MKNVKLHITSKSGAQSILLDGARANQIGSVISFNDPKTNPPLGINAGNMKNIILFVTDIRPGFPALHTLEAKEILERQGIDIRDVIIPSFEHVEHLIKNIPPALEHCESLGRDMLIHCWAGVSRSTAAAVITRYIQNGGDADEALNHILEIRPQADPNKFILQHADSILKTGGQLQYAIDKFVYKNLIKRNE